jgi:hypothetical protein
MPCSCVTASGAPPQRDAPHLAGFFVGAIGARLRKRCAHLPRECVSDVLARGVQDPPA